MTTPPELTTRTAIVVRRVLDKGPWENRKSFDPEAHIDEICCVPKKKWLQEYNFGKGSLKNLEAWLLYRGRKLRNDYD